MANTQSMAVEILDVHLAHAPLESGGRLTDVCSARFVFFVECVDIVDTDRQPGARMTLRALAQEYCHVVPTDTAECRGIAPIPGLLEAKDVYDTNWQNLRLKRQWAESWVNKYEPAVGGGFPALGSRYEVAPRAWTPPLLTAPKITTQLRAGCRYRSTRGMRSCYGWSDARCGMHPASCIPHPETNEYRR